MRRVLVIAAMTLLAQPLLLWGFSYALRGWWAREPDPSPWTQLRCGACKQIGTVHMCQEAE